MSSQRTVVSPDGSVVVWEGDIATCSDEAFAEYRRITNCGIGHVVDSPTYILCDGQCPHAPTHRKECPVALAYYSYR